MMRANAPLQRRGTHTVQTGLVSANRADTLLGGKLCSKCQAEKDMASMEPKTLNKDETKQVTESNDFKNFLTPLLVSSSALSVKSSSYPKISLQKMTAKKSKTTEHRRATN